MESISPNTMAEGKLTQARRAQHARATHTIHGGHDHELRQTLLASAAGHELAEHDSPGEATLQVLHAMSALARTPMRGKGRPATTSRSHPSATR